MCGISGIVNYNNEVVQEEDVRIMMLKMKHRGPDDEGLFIDQGIGLGFVRLSILDLSQAGHQPMFSHDNRFVIVFNGEVFNYLEIRDDLKSKYNFKTKTDTEVVLTAYQEWGEQCLDKFNGMFAFVIFDNQTKEIFGARDRFGIKPLYYFHDDEKFMFASEIKSLLPLITKRKANDQIIFDYLLFNRTDHTENTFFEDVKKLHHGTWFKLRNNNLVFKKWYILSDKIKTNQVLSPEKYRELFKSSLKIRLRADVPVGVSLSGGIDSSSIVASLINDFNLNDINTFSAVYGTGETTDESEFIDEFRKTVKNMHYTSPNSDSFFKDFDNFIDAHNEPVPDIGPYAQYKVMELASKYVKVSLDGQGADEQLAGYHYFFGSYFIELLKQWKLIKFAEENTHYIKKHRSIMALKFFAYYLLSTQFQKLLRNKSFPSIHQGFFESYKNRQEINKMLYNPKSLTESLLQHFEFKLEHLLRWEDLNSMHFSIEARVPFLDYKLVEATLSTPSYQKIFQGETKHLLREALRDILPEKISNRKDKKGFSNPREKWFKSEKFQRFVFELINSDSFKNRGYFDSAIANNQYKKHLEGKIDCSKEIWKWINLEIWFRKFIDNN